MNYKEYEDYKEKQAKNRFTIKKCSQILEISTTATHELRKKLKWGYVDTARMMILCDIVNQIKRSQGSVTTSTINAWLEYKECEHNELQRVV